MRPKGLIKFNIEAVDSGFRINFYLFFGMNFYQFSGMASNIDFIRQSSRLLQSGPSWYGPALSDLLKGVPFEDAAAHPLPGQHSIWELVLHLAAWRRFVVARLKRQDTYEVPLNSEADWPPVSIVSATAWENALKDLQLSSDQFDAALEAWDPKLLEQDVFGKSYPYHVMIFGLLQHDAYHTGQIAMLKKTLSSDSSH